MHYLNLLMNFIITSGVRFTATSPSRGEELKVRVKSCSFESLSYNLKYTSGVR